MNKKGIIGIVVVIIVVVLGFAMFGGKDTSITNPSDTNATSTGSNVKVPDGVTKDTYAPVTSDSTDTSLMARLKKASVGVTEDGKKVALVDGKATFKVEGTSDTVTVTLGDVAIEKASGNRKDVLATVSVDYGAKGKYSYVVLFEDTNGTLVDKSYGEIGSDLSVTGLRADSVTDSGNVEYVVSVSYKPRSADARSKFFIVEGGAFNLAKTISL